MWDLRRALLKKQEVESPRLADFDFRLRVRTMRLLAERIGGEPDALIASIAEMDDAAILATLAGAGHDPARLSEEHASCHAAAHRQLIDERGDPAPHRLA